MTQIEFPVLLKYFVWRLRREYDITLTNIELAAAVDVSRKTMTKWLNGAQSPRHRAQSNRPKLLKLANALQLTSQETDLMFASLSLPWPGESTEDDIHATASYLVAFLQGSLEVFFDLTETPNLESILPVPEPLLTRSDYFVGRDAEVRAISRLLMQEDTQMVTLVGSGGCGKTQLALHVAEHIKTDIVYAAERVAVISLASLDHAHQVLPRIAEGLGLQEGSFPDLAHQIRAYLTRHPTVIVLDNMEHVLGFASHLPSLLPTTTHQIYTRYLVTSRERLNLEREQVWEVPPLTIAQHPSLETIAQSPALDLFVYWARRINLYFEPTSQDIPTIATICDRLHGNPLAIRLAAALIDSLSPLEIEQNLHIRILDQAPRDVPRRHQSMQATLDWTYELLDEAAQHLFTTLAVFRGGAHAKAIKSVHDDSSITITHILGRLIRTFLIMRDDYEHGDSRYTMDEMVREYATERLIASDRHHVLAERHAIFFRDLSEQAMPRLRSSHQLNTLNLLDRERDNLHAALQWFLDTKQVHQAARMAHALGHYWYLRSLFQEGIAFLSQILDGELDTVLQIPLLYHLGWLVDTTGQPDDALRRYSQAEQLCAAVQDTHWLAFIRFGQGRAERSRDPEQARALLKEAVSLAQQQHNDWLWSSAMNIQGILEPDVDHAYPLLERSHQMARQLGDIDRLTFASINVGVFFQRQDDLPRAKAHFEAAYDLAVNLNNRYNIAFCLGNLGLVMADLREPAELILPRMEKSLELSRQLGDTTGVAVNLFNLAEHDLALGHVQTAAMRLNESLILTDLLAVLDLQAMVLDGLGGVAYALEHYHESVVLFGCAERVCPEYASPIRASSLEQLRHHVGADQVAAWLTQSRHFPMAEVMRISATLVELASTPNVSR